MSRASAHPLALAFTFALASAPGHGASTEIGDYLERDWFYVETLFFRHARPPDDEDFSQPPPRRYQLQIAALEPPPPAYSERIAAVPEDPHDFPRLEQFDCVAPVPAPWMETDIAVAAPAETEPGEDVENGDRPPAVVIPPVPTGPPAPSPEQRARWALEEFERGLFREGWRWQYDNLSLRTAAIRMRRSGDYEVMHHGKWLQPVPPRDSAAPLLIQLGAPDATFELEGSVSVTLGRFLHFATQVWLQKTPPETQSAHASEGETAGGSADTGHSSIDAAGYVLMSESRRMRPGELHYLDHPWLGILVRIEPAEAPDALLDRLESLPDGLPTAGSD